MEKDAEFQKRLLATFAVEAQEHLKGITDSLILLEQVTGTPGQEEVVEAVFREAHSLKGAARAVSRSDVESLCQALEGVFAAVKRDEITLSGGLVDLMQRARDVLARQLQAQATLRGEADSDRRAIVEELIDAAHGKGQARPSGAEPAPAPVAEQPAPPQPAPFMEDTVRVATSKLASLLLLSEEMVSAKLSAGLHAARMRELREVCGSWRKEWARVLPALPSASVALKRVAGGREDALSPEEARAVLKILEFEQWNVDFQKSLEARALNYLKAAERDNRALGGMVDNLLEEAKKLMMFPFSALLESFPKMVRDLARDRGKEVKLAVSGDELEIDRRILEEMKDPLLHLVRNSISHGIELPEEREGKNKPRRGNLSILISPREGRAEVVVTDDGAGIDVAQLRSVLPRLGVVPADKAAEMSDAEILPFIYHSGVSTSPAVTELSGRGLGLAIVREKVEKLGGSISVETVGERGTTFRIVLPLSVATFRGLLVRVSERIFVLPALHVERVVRIRWEDVATLQNQEVIDLEGRSVSLVRLCTVLELPEPERLTEQLQAVLVRVGEQSMALAVDEVLSEREILMKGLGPQLSRVRNIAGATLLGSGNVVPVLNLPDLIKTALRVPTPAAPFAAPAKESQPAVAPEARRRILVVEDSITSRTLMKNILESAGYTVSIAVDGLEALTMLRSEKFDLVVSDVDMPRMDGFQLTESLRSKKEFADLPVVLVTALGSPEDRERGIDVGANAYIVKSSFDQSDLLETIHRLC